MDNNVSSEKAKFFLRKYHMSASAVDPVTAAPVMRIDMQRGLNGEESSLPMIPTYLNNEGVLPFNVPVAVIDAGGTNFRTGLVTFTENGIVTEDFQKWPMPGTKEPASWETFIAFVADGIEPLMNRADRIGFCFSYSAEITPEIDGRVIRIDKEVVVTGCEGKYVGASLLEELGRRGITGKKVVVLNDTAAVLLGGAASNHLGGASGCGFIGQVSGTGTNTCCVVPVRNIGKLGRNDNANIIVNCESGLYDGIKGGRFDEELDRESNNPGSKFFEKLTAGVYLGELARKILVAASDENELSPESSAKVHSLPKIDSSHIDAWSRGERLDEASANPPDGEFVQTVALELIDRSARCMATNLLAIMLLTDTGKSADAPATVFAEGSLVQKCAEYQKRLKKYLDESGAKLGRFAQIRVGYETTIPGSAAAALLN